MKENPFQKIYDSYKYAIEHDIKPLDPKTWDNNYRARQIELFGTIPLLENEINSIKQLINESKK